VIHAHGPNAVGVYFGSGLGMDASGYRLVDTFYKALGAPPKFSPLTIDGTAKLLVAMQVGGFPGLNLPIQVEPWRHSARSREPTGFALRLRIQAANDSQGMTRTSPCRQHPAGDRPVAVTLMMRTQVTPRSASPSTATIASVTRSMSSRFWAAGNTCDADRWLATNPTSISALRAEDGRWYRNHPATVSR
jgi:hypothetical protein